MIFKTRSQHAAMNDLGSILQGILLASTRMRSLANMTALYHPLIVRYGFQLERENKRLNGHIYLKMSECLCSAFVTSNLFPFNEKSALGNPVMVR